MDNNVFVDFCVDEIVKYVNSHFFLMEVITL